MNNPKFQWPGIAGSDKYRPPIHVRYRVDPFSGPTANGPAARRGERAVPTGPAESHCRDDRRDAP